MINIWFIEKKMYELVKGAANHPKNTSDKICTYIDIYEVVYSS